MAKSFYLIRLNDNRIQTVQGEIINGVGYTQKNYDGPGTLWTATDIKTGVAVAHGDTKEKCIEDYKKKKRVIDKVKNTPLYQNLVKEFDDLVELL